MSVYHFQNVIPENKQNGKIFKKSYLSGLDVGLRIVVLDLLFKICCPRFVDPTFADRNPDFSDQFERETARTKNVLQIDRGQFGKQK